MPTRILHDYDPESDQNETDWLAAEHAAGWIPEYGYGLPVRISGKLLHRYAMIRYESEPPGAANPTSASS
jgi:hypothetical protein